MPYPINAVDKLLLENGSYLLLETGDKANLDKAIASDDPLNAANPGVLTPTFTFAGESLLGTNLIYELQIDTVNTFDSTTTYDDIIYDNSGSLGTQTTSPMTLPYTVGSGSNRLLVVSVVLQGSTAPTTPSGVTYGGVAMTLVKTTTGSNTGEFSNITWWELQAPAVGTANIVATFVPGALPDNVLSAWSFFGAQQSVVLDASGQSTGTTKGLQSATVTTVANKAWVLAAANYITDSSPSMLYSWQGMRQRQGMQINLEGRAEFSDTAGPVPAGTAQVMAFSLNGGTTSYFGVSAISIAPATLTAPLLDVRSDVNIGFTDDVTTFGNDKLLMETSDKLLLENSSNFILNRGYPSNNSVSYLQQTNLTAGINYYWRVRQKSALFYPAPPNSFAIPFDNTTLDPRLTQTTGGSATITYDTTGVTVNYPVASTSSTLGQVASNSAFNLTGVMYFIRVLAVPSAATSADAEFRLQLDANNWVRFVYEGGTLFAQKFVAGARTTVTSLAYSGANHLYWGIGESGGNTTFYVSSDGKTWNAFNGGSGTLANPIAMTALSVMILGSCFQIEVSPGTFKFDRLNVTDVLMGSFSAWSDIRSFLISTGTVYTQALTAGLSYTGSFIKRTNKSLTAGVFFTGAFVKSTSRALTAALSFTGAFLKKTIRAFTGGLSFTGAFVALSFHAIAFTASLGFTGAFSKRTNKNMTAGLSFTGSFIRLTTRAFTAGLSFTGNLVKRFVRSFTANIGFTGAFSKVTNKNQTAGLSFTGAFQKFTRRSLTAGLSFTGAFVKQTRRAVTAALSFTGALLSGSLYSRALTASLSFTGAFSKRANKNMTAGLSFTGAISKAVRHGMTAGLSFTGAVAKRVSKSLTGGLSFAGVLATLKSTGATVYTVAFTAGLSFSGSLQKQTRRAFTAALSFFGVFVGFTSIIYTTIRAIVKSSNKGITDSTSNDIANVNSSVKLDTVEANSKTSTVDSDTKTKTIDTSGTEITL